MRRVYHPDSGAFEFFMDPEDRAVKEVSDENKGLKQQVEKLEAMVKTLMNAQDVDLEKYEPEQLKTIAQKLGINTGRASNKGTLIAKIKDSGKSSSDILEAISKL